MVRQSTMPEGVALTGWLCADTCAGEDARQGERDEHYATGDTWATLLRVLRTAVRVKHLSSPL